MDEKRIIRFAAANGEDSDLEIVCGTFHFYVHELVLAPQSKYFENAMTVEMKEKRERKLEVQEQDPRVVQAFIFFAYKQHYDDRSGNDPDYDGEMTFNVKVYALAEEWQFPSLKALAKDKFDDLVKTKYEDFDFTNAVRVAYSSTPTHDSGLRLIAARKASEKYGDIHEIGAFKATIQEVPGFGADVAAILAFPEKQEGPPSGHTEFSCVAKHCGRSTLLPTIDVPSMSRMFCPHCAGWMYKQGHG